MSGVVAMALYTNKHDHSTAVAEEGHIVISVYTAPSSGVWLVCNTGKETLAQM